MGNKKNIFLIYPPTHENNRINNQLLGSFRKIKEPPMDLVNIATIAEEYNYKVFIKDYTITGNIINDIQEYKPNYAFIDISAFNFIQDLECAKTIKELSPNTVTILKGLPFFAYNTNAIYENPFIDYIILGETELTIRDILNNEADEDIAGICYRKNFQAEKNEPRCLIEDLDLIKIPNRKLLNNKKYTSILNNKPQATIEITRGCPHNCFFCLSTAINGKIIRHRSISNIIKEIKDCINNYNIKDFLLKSDYINFDNNWLTNLCNDIIKENIRINWTSNIIPVNIDENLIKLMKKSGCQLLELGIESGSQNILNNIGKKINIAEIKNTIKILKKYKIKFISNYIIGLPWDNENSIKETIQFEKSIQSDFVRYNIATPIPGSKYFAFAMLNKLSPQQISLHKAFLEPIVKTHSLSIDQIRNLHSIAIKEFYLNPITIFKILNRINSFKEIKNFIFTYTNLLRH